MMLSLILFIRIGVETKGFKFKYLGDCYVERLRLN